jgi:alanyl-tRNA synthetase
MTDVSSERLYYDDSYTTRFDARVATAGERAGQPAVRLRQTYFYPESGGQEADRGRIGAARVLDVQAGDDGAVWHVVDAPLPADAEVKAEVDWARRFDHMQQHTGQHILSAAFERVLSAPTVSSHLGEERSSIEVQVDEVDWRAIERLELAANRVVWENRPVERHWVDSAGLVRFRLRKPPAVTGRIRIVEIPDWDQSACGGTHTRHTGEVGAIKVVRWEKVRGNLRFEFLCGGRALSDHGWRTESMMESARRRTLKDRELIAHLERAAAERDAFKKQAAELTDRLRVAEAAELVGRPPAAVRQFTERTREALRRLAVLCLEHGAPWVALGAPFPEPGVVVGRAKSGTVDLRELVPGLLERSRGKGGGSPDLVQCTAADAAAAEAAWRWVVGELEARAR